ncbi:MAG: response regulator transcription factor [Burkholderiales bacterium]|nr:response regulator transcription factor [Burkholderiales bacterium]MCW5605275.1 response regulator transcription factor [Burkholderiales bacterium]
MRKVMNEQDAARPKTVGIVEDDDSLVRILRKHLKVEGYRTAVMQSPEETIDRVLGRELDMLLIDLALPGCDGVEIARSVREISPIPIVIITGRGEIDARVGCLDAGADDYLTKPFDPRELSARLRAIFRRVEANPGRPQNGLFTWRLSACRLLPLGRQLVGNNHKVVRLTEVEYLTLEFMLQQLGSPVSREELSFRATGRHWEPPDRRIDVHIARIRRKLAMLGERKLTVRAVRSVGYIAEGIAHKLRTETDGPPPAG